MTIQSLRGFRDFYPEDQAVIDYLQRAIASVCAEFGYESFEGPMLEPIELYAAKSSEEIVQEQAFVFEDRGGERITLRPELTPTLARMVAARQSQLSFPLRWWSFGRFWRYERPQKGRAREFYQWNCDLIGDGSLNADVEILEILIRFFERLGLTSQDVVLELSDRSFLNSYLAEQGIDETRKNAIFRLLDRFTKLTPEQRETTATEFKLTPEDLAIVTRLATGSDELWQQAPRLRDIMASLKEKGLSGWIQPNLAIVRGFQYYTGIVFEASDRQKSFRAILGGGRYSNLIAAVGGQPIEGIGMGMGDMVITGFLAEKGLLPPTESSASVCLIGLNDSIFTAYQTTATSLRSAGIRTLAYGTSDGIGKGLKFANQKNIPWAVIIGENEAANNQVTLKNLITGEQQTSDIATTIEAIQKTL